MEPEHNLLAIVIALFLVFSMALSYTLAEFMSSF